MYDIKTFKAVNLWKERIAPSLSTPHSVVKFLEKQSERVEVSSPEWDGSIYWENGHACYSGIEVLGDVEFILSYLDSEEPLTAAS